jgi:hypothetical protein
MSAPITEAHYDLRRQVIFSDADEGAELIADSEARATERLRKEIDWLQLNNDMLTDNPVGHARAVAERQAIIDERDQLRAEAGRLKGDGAASAFINMSCRASRAETDRNNLRADLDAIKAILTEEKARAERAEAELATERARVDWLEKRGPWESWNGFGETGITLRENIRDGIDAAMKEGA